MTKQLVTDSAHGSGWERCHINQLEIMRLCKHAHMWKGVIYDQAVGVSGATKGKDGLEPVDLPGSKITKFRLCHLK